jgi:hypothetical protein
MPTVRDPSIPIDEYGFRRPRRRHPAQPHRGGIDGRHHEFYDFYVYATAAVSVFPQLFLWVFGDRLYLQTCGPETNRLGK